MFEYFLITFYTLSISIQSEVHLIRFDELITKYYEDNIFIEPQSKTYLVISFDSNKFNLIFPDHPDVSILSLTKESNEYKEFDQFNISSFK